ncbi:MAG: hypothetical protein MUC48_03785 [Leptolyngbya sp. Prado105]|jgi:hypothetical protein|nr:hypothetical protein [Leptolyngbya sp. Prado105]
MNGQSHENITTEDLKAITQAPTVEKPLVNEGEFPVQLARSSRPVWTKPVPKLALIGLLLIPVFGFAALFLAGGGRFKQAQKNSPQATTTETTSQPETVPEELSRLREENGKLKANAAIGDQDSLQNRLSKKSKPEQKLPRIPANSTAKATDSSKSVTVASTPPQIVSQTSPPRLVSAPVSPHTSRYTPAARSMAVREQATQTEVQPDNSMEQWQLLAQLGSYGSSRSEQSSDSGWSNASSSHRNSIEERSHLAQADESENSLQSIPTARIAPTSAIQADTEIVADIDQVSETSAQNDTAQSEQLNQTTPERTIAETQTETNQPAVQTSTSQPPVLEDAEAAILQNQIRQHSLIAGETTPGVLATPITLSDFRGTEASKRPNQFTIVLTQPLKDSTGQVAVPHGAHLLVQVDQFSRTGQVQLSATTAVWTENSLQKELNLPVGAIQVRGENGKPLVAKQLEDRGKEIASMDAGQFLLGAVRRSAQLFTRSNSRIQTGDGTTVITESNPKPNILAGALEGGSDAVLSSIEERNKQAIKEMEQRPNSLFIASGSPVQVFVNQSMLLPN